MNSKHHDHSAGAQPLGNPAPGSLADERGEQADYARSLGAALRQGDQGAGNDPRWIEQLLSATRAVQPGPGVRGRTSDPSWRGDLALVRGYLGERLAHSPLLRLAAASLLVHLIAVPAVLAYVYLEKRQPELMLGFEKAPDPHPFEADLPEVAEALEAFDLDGEAPLAAANAKAWDRAQLAEVWEAGELPLSGERIGMPALDAEAGAGLEDWLALRVRQVADWAQTGGAAAIEALDPGHLQAAASAARGGSPLSALTLLVAIEVHLDRFAMGLPLPASWEDSLAVLAKNPVPGQAGSELMARTLDRSRAYGLRSKEGALRGEHAGSSPGHPSPSPLDPTWIRALRGAAAELGQADADRLLAPVR